MTTKRSYLLFMVRRGAKGFLSFEGALGLFEKHLATGKPGIWR